MKTHAMIPIFDNAESHTLLEFINTLTTDEISELCSHTLFDRGEEYFESGLVKEVFLTRDNFQLEASVSGNKDYHIRLSQTGNDIFGSCSCPYDDGICKHIIAVLLYCADDPSAIGLKSDHGSKMDIRKYLESLSKEELIVLILENAREEFLLMVKNMISGTSDAKKAFNKIKKEIQSYLEDEELLHDPSEMEAALGNAFIRLNGLESKLQDEIKELIFHVIRTIDEAIDEGYLYEDNHYTDYSFECPEEFRYFVKNYVNALKFSDKMKFLCQLDDILSSSSYDTFGVLVRAIPDMTNDQDLPALRTFLVESEKSLSLEMKQQFYLKTRNILPDGEREKILTGLAPNSESFTIELAELYKNNQQVDKAINCLKKFISASKSYSDLYDVYASYLEIVRESNDNLKSVAQKAIHDCPTRKMLIRLSELLPLDHKNFEDVVEKKNPTELLLYLESEKRLAEAVTLITKKNNISDSAVYDFYKKHKLTFPKETKQYMGKVISHHLEFTGDFHYDRILDALRVISKIDKASATMIAGEIRKNYNRRRNLIRLIAEF